MRTDRLLAITMLLMRHDKLTAVELAARFEVTPRTIYRDIDALCMAGVPVITTQGMGGGIALMPGFVLEKTLLTESDKQTLLSALDTMNAAALPDAPALRDKLGALLGPNERRSWLNIDFTPWGMGSSQKQAFMRLREAILLSRVVVFDYIDRAGARSCREVEPEQLFFRGMGWYLWAYCRMRSQMRVFRLTRMRQVRLSGEGFTPSPRELSKSNYTEPIVQLVLRFDAALEQTLLDFYPEEMIGRGLDGSLWVTPEYPDDAWVISHILSFGDKAEVLHPPHVRAKVADMVRAMAAKYASDAIILET